VHWVHVVAVVQLRQFDEQPIQVFVAELRKVEIEQLELQVITPDTTVCTYPLWHTLQILEAQIAQLAVLQLTQTEFKV
jgi:hypothetical protein